MDATHWNTYRGTIPSGGLGSRLPGFPYDQVCHESADSFADGPTMSSATIVPALGTAHYYFVAGENNCAESILGRSSSGEIIPNMSSCPTPP